MPRHFAIVPAAGTGARFGAGTPKQYLPLAGRPLIHHTLATLCRSPKIERVLVVLAPDDAHWAGHDWRELGPKLETVYAGGATRAASVLAGLSALATAAADDDWVLVHDAARPCLSPALLDALLAELADDPVGGLLAVPVADTLKRQDEARRVAATEPRDGLWQAQTPQMFRHATLAAALSAATGLTDEAGAVETLGLRPKLVAGESGNLKVTYPADLALAELILFARRER
ncbi:MAG: 2-C-methyl-D-erythritol 4-phosphate cytidylyltransferase [Azospira sp.]|jgi:2-C-methyl-D-erythritol 4-phosphate cytidylyltransferase|nr:2-C-methyl-D-erythritol 4-phosphate cytidylyltransferase [Azospira sp.]